jgi:RimJ/RimL family protein N-acetyltransferase
VNRRELSGELCRLGAMRKGRKSSILAVEKRGSRTHNSCVMHEPIEIGPVTLEGRAVRLEPLTHAHHGGLCEVGLEPELWKWIPYSVSTPDEMAAYIDKALDEQARGTSVPFATIDQNTSRVIGSTRYMNIEREHCRVEIGSTWIGGAWQRSAINTEAKYLLLRHAFETLGCLRVELKTDALNEKSRAAILRIGAKEEGIFRNHMVMSTGRIRHSVYYSIVEAEWPEVRARLQEKMAAQPGAVPSKNGDSSRPTKPAA